MTELEKQAHAVRLAYDDAPPRRDLEAAAVIRAAVNQVLPLLRDGAPVLLTPEQREVSAEFLAIADKLEEDGLDY